ncbi:MAG: peptidoglycan bridge formation glycyltransferase FemA/FemB family protein [Spirochaetales bacterium]|nr:peptidoglycan bridge formation glycyltransferase FemA/FemB family protein [Spirochaetales bacterium]
MNIKIVNKKAITRNENFLQSQFWAEVKKRYGWNSLFLQVEEKEETILFLYKRIFKFFYMVYSGRPNLEGFTDKELKELNTFLKKQIKGKILFIRYDLKVVKDFNLKLKKASSDIQVPNTVVIYKNEEENLLAAMKSKTRYNIRLAEKKGVTVREAAIEELDRWYSLYETTAKRDKIAIHSFEYYRDVINLANESGSCAKIYFAEHEGSLLAGIIVLLHGKEAVYLYGASSNEKRNLMPAYKLQWVAISESFKAGAESYDMFGIPASDNPDDPMHGLYRFKTGFGGEIENYLGCYDFTPSPILYSLFRVAERLRTFIFKKVLKR